MPSDMPRKQGTTNTQAGSADLPGSSERFGLRDDGASEGTDASIGTVDRSVLTTDGTVYRSNDPSGRLVHGRYRLIAQLGAGGMGVTYRAWDTQAGIPVVVKMPKREVRHDREVMARFSREIAAMAAVPHKSIVPITDSGDDNGCPFVVMRFLPGGSLADYRHSRDTAEAKKNPPGMLHFWLPGIAAALDHIHSKGMLHRDVKPGNIFLDGFLKPYLGDFGIAKVVDDSGGLEKEQTLTATRMAVGTPEYMAPELFRPRVQADGRVDQYALAVTVYEMLSGEKPFTGSMENIVVEHASLPVPPLERKCAELRPSVYAAVHKALSKNPQERFPTCEEFATAVLAEIKPLEPEADTVRLLCPSCRNILKLPQKTAAKKGRCPRCHSVMDVAEDIGSLWLEGETHGDIVLGDNTSGVDVSTGDVTVTRPTEPLSSRVSRSSWSATWAALLCGLVIGVIGGIGGYRSLGAKVGSDWLDNKAVASLESDDHLNRLLKNTTQRANESAAQAERLQSELDDAKQTLQSRAGELAVMTQKLHENQSAVADLGLLTADRDALAADKRRLTEAVAIAVRVPQQAFALAEKWWNAADTGSVTADTAAVMRAHAASLYELTLAALDDPSQKRVAELRIRLGQQQSDGDRSPKRTTLEPLRTFIHPRSDPASAKIKERFAANGWSVEQMQVATPSQELPERCLVTVLGGSSHDQDGFSPPESEVIATHVREGGALLAAGLSWTWTSYGAKPAETFPLNQLGQRLGFVITPKYAGEVRLPQQGLLKRLSREQLNFTGMVPSCVIATEPDHETLLEDENGNAIIVGLPMGKGRIVVCGHPGVLEGDPEVLRRIISYLIKDEPAAAGGESVNGKQMSAARESEVRALGDMHKAGVVLPPEGQSPAQGKAPLSERRFWRSEIAGNPAFHRNDAEGWAELHADGTRYRFVQSAETPDYIELRCDMGRDLRIRLWANGSQLQQNMSDWVRWHAGAWVNEAAALSAIP